MKLRTKAVLSLASAVVLVTGGASLALAVSGAPTPPDVPASPSAARLAEQRAAAHIAAATNPNPNPVAESSTVSLDPCTVFDTAKAGGAISNGHSRLVTVRGTSSLASQGGPSTGCGIPAAATSITAVITTTSPTATGRLQWQASSSQHSIRAISFTKGVTTSTTATLPLLTTESGRIIEYGGATDVQISVVAYSVPPLEGMVAVDGSLYAGSSRIVSSEKLGTGTYRVQFDRDVDYCTPMATAYYGTVYAFAGPYVYLYSWDLDGSTHAEVLKDAYIYVSVLC